MIENGDVFTVANNRQVEIQAVGSASVEVRVMEGNQAGRTSWVAPQFVQAQASATSHP